MNSLITLQLTNGDAFVTALDDTVAAGIAERLHQVQFAAFPGDDGKTHIFNTAHIVRIDIQEA